MHFDLCPSHGAFRPRRNRPRPLLAHTTYRFLRKPFVSLCQAVWVPQPQGLSSTAHQAVRSPTCATSCTDSRIKRARFSQPPRNAAQPDAIRPIFTTFITPTYLEAAITPPRRALELVHVYRTCSFHGQRACKAELRKRFQAGVHRRRQVFHASRGQALTFHVLGAHEYHTLSCVAKDRVHQVPPLCAFALAECFILPGLLGT